MAVEGKVTKAVIESRKDVVTLRGIGTVDLGSGPSGFFENVSFEVRVTGGGVGLGSIQLTVFGAFDGVPGDTIPGNGNYDLAPELVVSGHILVH